MSRHLRNVPQFSPGDRVAYSADFLRSTGQQTGDVPFWCGKVLETRQIGARTLVVVEWDHNPGDHWHVLDSNLAHVGPNSRFCAC